MGLFYYFIWETNCCRKKTTFVTFFCVWVFWLNWSLKESV